MHVAIRLYLLLRSPWRVTWATGMKQKSRLQMQMCIVFYSHFPHMVALLYPICLFLYILHTYHFWINVLHFICKEHYIYHTLWARMFQYSEHYPVNSSYVLMQWIHPYTIRYTVTCSFPLSAHPCSSSHAFMCSPMTTHGKIGLSVIHVCFI